ncbi:MAG: hypothetical protein QM755_22640 [Luteolibacter sp.]
MVAPIQLALTVAIATAVGAVPPADRQQAKVEQAKVAFPGPKDPRTKPLGTIKIPATEFKNVPLDEWINALQLSQKLRCSVVLRGGVGNLKVSLKFKGGTLRQLLDQLAVETPVRLKFEDLCVSFSPV